MGTASTNPAGKRVPSDSTDSTDIPAPKRDALAKFRAAQTAIAEMRDRARGRDL